MSKVGEEQMDLGFAETSAPTRALPSGIADRWPEGSATRAFWRARKPSDELRLRASIEEFERLGPAWDRHAERARKKLRRLQ